MKSLQRYILPGMTGAVLLSASVLPAAPTKSIVLWPTGAPGEKEDIGEEKDTTKEKDNLVAGKRVIRLGNVSNPTITIYQPPKEKRTGAAMVICPGGGYYILAMDLEGSEVAEWLNSIGITAVLLKYRVPRRKGRAHYEAPLQDVQRAMGVVRHRAKEWGIDPQRVGVMGFSAGAHLSAALSCNYSKRTYKPVDAADKVSCRPDFAMLVYQGYLATGEKKDRLPQELKVTAKTPPTFLVQSGDDGVGVEGSLVYYRALNDAKVPAELHLYAKGGHGYGLRPTKDRVTRWPELAAEWLEAFETKKEPVK